MKKISRPTAYTGRLKILNRENINKRVFDTERSKVNLKLEHEHQTKHVNKGDGVTYPEDRDSTCACKDCGCK